MRISDWSSDVCSSDLRRRARCATTGADHRAGNGPAGDRAVTGFAYRVVNGMAEKIDPEAALAADGDLIWVHLSTNNREAQDWLGEKAGLADYIVDALTATESRPRCEAAGPGAYINQLGRTHVRTPVTNAHPV